MKMCLQSVCQLALLSLCCVLVAVRESHGSFVPGRCTCPTTQNGVRGQVRDLQVYPVSPSCDRVTVILTLKSDGQQVCINPESPLGKRLVRCWNRVHKKGQNIRRCLRAKRNGRGRAVQMRSHSRRRGQNRRTQSPS